MTLRGRLTLWFTLAVTVTMSLYGAFVYVTVQQLLLAQLDRELDADHERAESMLVHDATLGRARWDPSLAASAGHDNDTPPIVWITGADGRTVERSAEFADDGTTRINVWSHTVKTGTAGSAAETVTVRVARALAPLRAELRTLLLVLVLGLGLGVGAAAAGGSFLAARALRPVGEMANRARRITADRLSERLPVPDTKDEVGQLATVFNQTLERLEAAFDRLRRFTADASHELRTPLTAFRAVGEVALRERRDADACRAVIASMLEEGDRLTRLVEDLLLLSRADARAVSAERRDVDLAELTRGVVSHLAVLAEEKHVMLDVRAPAGAVVWAEPGELRRALANVLDNAIRYSPLDTTVALELRADGEFAILEVSDRGPGIDPIHHERIFDRFYRVDRARARDSGGTGLGLAIARAAVENHGGRIELASVPGEGSTFRIVLPRSHGQP